MTLDKSFHFSYPQCAHLSSGSKQNPLSTVGGGSARGYWWVVSMGLGNTSEPVVSGRLSSRPLATRPLRSFHNDLGLLCVTHMGTLTGLPSSHSLGISGETDARWKVGFSISFSEPLWKSRWRTLPQPHPKPLTNSLNSTELSLTSF